MKFTEYVFLFVFFSFIGWILEVIFRSFQAKAFINPGFLKGPYLPIYGTGALILTICATHLEGSSLPVKGLVYLFVTTGLEFITGFIFDGCLHTPLWDYSEQRFRIKNYVCLQFSLYWLVLAFAFEYLVLPVYLSVFNLLNPVAVDIFAIVVSGVLIVLVLNSDREMVESCAHGRNEFGIIRYYKIFFSVQFKNIDKGFL